MYQLLCTTFIVVFTSCLCENKKWSVQLLLKIHYYNSNCVLKQSVILQESITLQEIIILQRGII